MSNDKNRYLGHYYYKYIVVFPCISDIYGNCELKVYNINVTQLEQTARGYIIFFQKILAGNVLPLTGRIIILFQQRFNFKRGYTYNSTNYPLLIPQHKKQIYKFLYFNLLPFYAYSRLNTTKYLSTSLAFSEKILQSFYKQLPLLFFLFAAYPLLLFVYHS